MPEDPAWRARFRAVMDEHGPGLERVARAYAARTHEVEDLAQEIALAIWRALPGFRGECSDRTFAFRIAHNRGLTFSARRRPVGEELQDAPSPERSPEDSLGDAERRHALWRAIHRLAPPGRAVLTLALEGLDHREIGEVLGITANAVAVRLTRAREELRRELGGAQ